MKRILIAVAAAVGAVLMVGTASATIQSVTVDRDAQFVNGSRVRLSVTITCTTGEFFQVQSAQVRANKGDTIGENNGPNGTCTGAPQTVFVNVNRDSGPDFRQGTLGEATVTVRTGTTNPNVITDTETVVRRVDIN